VEGYETNLKSKVVERLTCEGGAALLVGRWLVSAKKVRTLANVSHVVDEPEAAGGGFAWVTEELSEYAKGV
jgi:hypothetical protein